MLRLLDSTALRHISTLSPGEPALGNVLTGLNELIGNEELGFCRETVKELAKLSPTGAPTAWAKQCAQSLWTPATGWLDIQNVVQQLEDVVDFELQDEESEMIYVLALAQRLTDEHHVVVVTQDDIDKPDIVSMATACETLGIEREDLLAFYDNCQIEF